jgi:hypothetical protein
MTIKEINIRDLTIQCVDLLMKTYTELGQTPTEQVVLLMSQSLANDLKKRFKDFTWIDVNRAFERGVRETEDFHMNVKTYFRWLNFWKKNVVWEAEYEHLTLGKPKSEIPYYQEQEEIKLLTTKNKNNENL